MQCRLQSFRSWGNQSRVQQCAGLTLDHKGLVVHLSSLRCHSASQSLPFASLCSGHPARCWWHLRVKPLRCGSRQCSVAPLMPQNLAQHVVLAHSRCFLLDGDLGTGVSCCLTHRQEARSSASDGEACMVCFQTMCGAPGELILRLNAIAKPICTEAALRSRV